MRALVVLSGGQDSSTCLALAIADKAKGFYEEVHAITFDYGQRHSAEIASAREMMLLLGVDLASWELIEMPAILVGTSPLVNHRAEVESYKDAASLPGGLEKTFVPMRNALFLTIAANRAAALAQGHDVDVITGVSQEDYGGYPDCREAFIEAQASAIREALADPSFGRVEIRTPLLHESKCETVELAERTPLGRTLNGLSHTCYNGAVPPCGTCHACLLRAKGYAEAGVVDPLLERLERVKT